MMFDAVAERFAEMRRRSDERAVLNSTNTVREWDLLQDRMEVIQVSGYILDEKLSV